jgi:hypothetical protein
VQWFCKVLRVTDWREKQLIPNFKKEPSQPERFYSVRSTQAIHAHAYFPCQGCTRLRRPKRPSGPLGQRTE